MLALSKYSTSAACGLSMMVLQFNGTSTEKGSYSAKTGDNDYNVNSIRYSLRTALCESIRYQAKSEQNVQDLIPRVRHGKAALMHPVWIIEQPPYLKVMVPFRSNTFNTS